MKKIIFSLLLFFGFNVVKATTGEIYNIDFNLKRDSEVKNLQDTAFKITYEDGKVENINVLNEFHLIISDENSKKVKVEEISCDPRFILENNSYEIDFKENNQFTINLNYKRKIVNVKWKAYLWDNNKDKDKQYEYHPNIEVYNSDLEYLRISDKTGYLKLPADNYILYDTIYDKKYKVKFYEYENEFFIYEKAINGIKTNGKVNSICSIEKCFTFHYKDKIYFLDEPLAKGYYKINNIEYFLEDTMPQVSGVDELILKLDLKDEILEDLPLNDDPVVNEPLPNEKEDKEEIIVPDLDNKEETGDEILEVEVPNTGLVSESIIVHYEEKKYNKYY